MLDRETLISFIEQHVEGSIALEDLAEWAEEVYREADLEPVAAPLLARILSTIIDSIDGHRFRWEEPDFLHMIEELGDTDEDPGKSL
jgi:hypothetical protein